MYLKASSVVPIKQVIGMTPATNTTDTHTYTVQWNQLHIQDMYRGCMAFQKQNNIQHTLDLKIIH